MSTTPKEIMRRVLSHADVRGNSAQVYIVADQVKALDAAGYVIVPKEPTQAMADAAVDATNAGIRMSWRNLTPQLMFRQGYEAMIAAAKQNEPANP